MVMARDEEQHASGNDHDGDAANANDDETEEASK
jgi:hypothetical protein